MKRFRDAIPDKVLDEILPKKLNTSLSTEQIYTPLKQMILSGKLNHPRLEGEGLFNMLST